MSRSACETVDPEEMIHPYRLVMDDSELERVYEGISNNEQWMSVDQLEAVQDIMFDHIAAKLQTHPGEIILQ